MALRVAMADALAVPDVHLVSGVPLDPRTCAAGE